MMVRFWRIVLLTFVTAWFFGTAEALASPADAIAREAEAFDGMAGAHAWTEVFDGMAGDHEREAEDSEPFLSEGNTVSLMARGSDFYRELSQAIESATRYICFEYYSVGQDSVSTAILTQLKRKAASGVAVYAMIDNYGSRHRNMPMDTPAIRGIRNAGLDIAIFNPHKVSSPLPRDHRKLTIIDGRIAFVGGMNINDRYVRHSDELGYVRDYTLKIEGPAVALLQQAFEKSWNDWSDHPQITLPEVEDGGFSYGGADDGGSRVTSGVAEGGVPRVADGTGSRVTDETAEGSGSCESTGKAADPECGSVVNTTVTVCPTEGLELHPTVRDNYLSLINAAESTIVMANAYLMPSPPIIHALKAAAQRGVKVDITIGSNTDLSPMLKKRQSHFLEAIAKCENITVHIIEDSFFHAKALSADTKRLILGSANLDYLSRTTNYELCVIVDSPELAAQFEATLADNHSHPLPH